jgi:hypothetical protein
MPTRKYQVGVFVQGTLTERERLNTVDLLVLKSLDQLLDIANIIYFFTKQVP